MLFHLKKKKIFSIFLFIRFQSLSSDKYFFILYPFFYSIVVKLSKHYPIFLFEPNPKTPYLENNLNVFKWGLKVNSDKIKQEKN